MTKKMNLIRFFLSLSIFISIHILSNAQTVNYNELKVQQMKNTEMEEGYAYFLHYSDNKYLIYVEYYTQEIFLYDLEKETLAIRKIINKGKGPNELTSITGAVVIGDYIYVGGRDELKLIQINIVNEEMKELRLDNIILRSMRVYNNNIIIENSDITSLFMKYDIKNAILSRLDFAGFDPVKEFSNTFFFKEGDLIIIDNKLVFTTTYMPFIYILDVENKKLNKFFAFDESNVKKPRQVNLGGDQIATLPPESNFYTPAIIKAPGYANKVILLSEGKGREQNYSYDHLYELDLENGNITAAYQFHLNISSIVSNDAYIYINSNDEAAIYKAKVN